MRNAFSAVAGLIAISLTAGSTRLSGSMSGIASSPISGTNPSTLQSSFTLTPELVIQTTVSGPEKNTVQIDFYDGSVLLDSVALTQASPHAVLAQALIFGKVSISSGATLDLTIPTKSQTGQVFLQARFQSPNIPSTSISSAIATWAL